MKDPRLRTVGELAPRPNIVLNGGGQFLGRGPLDLRRKSFELHHHFFAMLRSIKCDNLSRGGGIRLRRARALMAVISAVSMGQNHARTGRGPHMRERHFEAADMAMAILMAIRKRDGTDKSIEAAKHMIYGAVAIIAHEHGPNEARRILQIVGEAQGRVS
jgi:hypothetical protein